MLEDYRPATQLTVAPQLAGQRIDNFLFCQFKSVPKRQIYCWLRTGQIRCNGRRCKPHVKLQAADRLRLPPMRLPTQSSSKPVPVFWLTRLMEAIIYEDDAVLVVNKPSGLAVHGGSGISNGVIEILRQSLQNPNLALVHRLDKATSGCLVVAKTRQALVHLHQRFRLNQVKKVYLTRLHGHWYGSRQRHVCKPLKRFVVQGGERLVSIDENGKPSETMFQLVENHPHHCLVKAYPKTGRTHQIRVHALSMGQSVIGDDKYRCQHAQQQPITCQRLMLHAAQLRFHGPLDYRFDAPLPTDWQLVTEEVSSR